MRSSCQRNQTPSSSSKCTEVELQIIKMTNVTRDIRIVIENILDAKDLEKRVDEELLDTFSSQLKAIIQNLRFFPTNNAKIQSLKVSEKIAECREEDEHSDKTANRLKPGNYNLQSSHLTKDQGRDSIELSELYEANQDLTEQNEFLTKKLQEAESYIKKIEYENNLLMGEMSTARAGQKSGFKASKTEHNDDKESLHVQLSNQNEQLRVELQQTKEFIIRNNEDFVRELQKYNQKIWRLEREVQDSKAKMCLAQSKYQQGDLLINKLREENFQLEVLARNMKNLIGQQDRKDSSIKDYSQGQDSDRLRPQSSKLKDFFRDRIQQTLRRKQAD